MHGGRGTAQTKELPGAQKVSSKDLSSGFALHLRQESEGEELQMRVRWMLRTP